VNPKGVRKQPQRTCIACQRTDAKRGLVRVVRTPTGEVAIDLTGKLAGRGAYLCKDKRCWLAALERKRIEQALRVELGTEQRAMLEQYAAQLPAESDQESTV
jgi:uncharacterized protein